LCLDREHQSIISILWLQLEVDCVIERPPVSKRIQRIKLLKHFEGVHTLGNKLYVGNLSYNVGDSELEQLLSTFGTVSSAKVITDRDTGRSKGFGFVEMGTNEEASAAIAALNGKEVDGRALTVNEAKPKTDNGGGRGGFGGGRGGYGGGRGGYGGGGGGGHRDRY
jgi:uncharacterized membrane protein YgcG